MQVDHKIKYWINTKHIHNVYTFTVINIFYSIPEGRHCIIVLNKSKTSVYRIGENKSNNKCAEFNSICITVFNLSHNLQVSIYSRLLRVQITFTLPALNECIYLFIYFIIEILKTNKNRNKDVSLHVFNVLEVIILKIADSNAIQFHCGDRMYGKLSGLQFTCWLQTIGKYNK